MIYIMEGAGICLIARVPRLVVMIGQPRKVQPALTAITVMFGIIAEMLLVGSAMVLPAEVVIQIAKELAIIGDITILEALSVGLTSVYVIEEIPFQLKW